MWHLPFQHFNTEKIQPWLFSWIEHLHVFTHMRLRARIIFFLSFPLKFEAVQKGLQCLEATWRKRAITTYEQALLAYTFGLAGQEDKRAFFFNELSKKAKEEGECMWLFPVKPWRSKVTGSGIIIMPSCFFISHWPPPEPTHIPCFGTDTLQLLFLLWSGGSIYWDVEESIYWVAPILFSRASLAHIETTCYGLLALLHKPQLTSEELTYASQIVQWVAKQQNAYGGFASMTVTLCLFQVSQSKKIEHLPGTGLWAYMLTFSN